MRKTTEKVAVVALICISLVFIVATVLFFCGVATPGKDTDNGFTIALLIVLGVAFVGLSAYLIYENFSSRSNLRRILIYCDSESAVSASRKVVQNIVDGCSKKISGVKIKRTRINVDEKQGFVLTLNIIAEAEVVQPALDELRGMLFESFEATLGLKFNSINFVVDKLAKKFVPTEKIVEEAEQQATEESEGKEEATAEETTKEEAVAAEIIENKKEAENEIVEKTDKKVEEAEENKDEEKAAEKEEVLIG